MIEVIQKLTGYEPSNKEDDSLFRNTSFNDFWKDHKSISYKQLNEILLDFGYEPVTEDFFNLFFLGIKKITKNVNCMVVNKEAFNQGIEKFQKSALLKYGNIKYGFKTLGKLDIPELCQELKELEPIHENRYITRLEPIKKIEPIEPEDTFFLGHLFQNQISSGNDQHKKNKMKEIQEKGKKNLKIYLCSDEMDVYVATSMRDVEDFYFVGTVAKQLFGKPNLKKLNLRYFDPTQSYCDNRIEKGLVESLMLKRAKCTVYCAQTSESLGKDSELAITLSQGKPVIVYVPQISDEDNKTKYKEMYKKIVEIENKTPEEYYCQKLLGRHITTIMRSSNPHKEINDIFNFNAEELLEKLIEFDGELFEKKAKLLKQDHPLGIQVNLKTGVANGVLVVRRLTDCAQVLEQIMKNSLEFKIEDKNSNKEKSLNLVETITNCTYRIMVKDPLLNNSFWNFYKKEF